MSAVRLLEEGLKTRDWGKVGEAYVALTGQAAPDGGESPDLTFILWMRDEIAEHLGSKETRRFSPGPLSVAKRSRPKKDPTVNGAAVVETPPEATVTRGGRPAYRPVEAACVKCGKKAAVHPTEISGGDIDAPSYTCNRCLTGGR